jgi:hypothetical protein
LTNKKYRIKNVYLLYILYNDRGSEVSSNIASAVQKRTPICGSFLNFTSIYCIFCEICNNGSDGDSIITSDFFTVNLHEIQKIIDPLFLFVVASQTRYYVKPTQIPQDKWQEVASRKANGESLRTLAVAYGVSYETIRQVLKSL